MEDTEMTKFETLQKDMVAAMKAKTDNKVFSFIVSIVFSLCKINMPYYIIGLKAYRKGFRFKRCQI